MGNESRLKAVDATSVKDLLANATTPPVLDHFGRRLIIGGQFSYAPPHAIPVTVVDIMPIVDPNAPPGATRITLQAVIEIHAFERVPIPTMQLITYPKAAPASGATDDPGTKPPGDGLPATSPSGIQLTDIK